MTLTDYFSSLTPLWIYLILLAGFCFLVKKKKYYKFDHEQLLKQRPFQVALIVPFFSFLYFGVMSWWGHTPKFDSEGMSVFLDISKLPLLILSLTLPLGALTANIHRTYQIKRQIDLSEEKNLSDIYYAHNKYYVETFSKINANRELITPKSERVNESLKGVNNLAVSIGSPHSLYSKIFPSSSPVLGANYTPSKKALSTIHRALDRILDSFSALDSETLKKKIETGVMPKDEELRKIRTALMVMSRYIGVDNYINYYRFFQNKDDNKILELKIALLELTIFCHKLYLVLSEILNVIGVTKNTHPELIGKCKKLRTLASDKYDLLKNLN